MVDKNQDCEQFNRDINLQLICKSGSYNIMLKRTLRKAREGAQRGKMYVATRHRILNASQIAASCSSLLTYYIILDTDIFMVHIYNICYDSRPVDSLTISDYS